MRRNPLPTTAQLLWYKLMHFANVHYWPEWFSIDNDRLTILLNAGSDQTVRNARKILIDEGYFIYEKGVKGKPGRYKMCSVQRMELLERGLDPDEIVEPEESIFTETEDITRYFGYTEAAGLELKKVTQQLYETYLPNETPTEQDERRVFFFIKEQTEGPDGQWTLTFPREKKELLAYAFEQAQGAGALNWNYIAGIYRNFNSRGVKNVDDAIDYEFNRNQRKGRW